MTKANPAIGVSGLHKSFGRTQALDGLDLTVERGEVHGFLGPNGAGKSTTIRVLLGLLRADSGTARILGRDPWNDAVELHRRIAYVPGDVTLWRNLSGGEVIDLCGRLRGGLDAMAGMLGMVAALYTVQAVLRLHREETDCPRCRGRRCGGGRC